MDGLGRIPVDIRLDLARSKERDNLAKQTRSWSGDYDYGKSDMVQAANGHYSDSGKLPWHPTFSTESEYSSPEFKGGEWKEIDGKMTYTPSEDMIKAGTTKGLVEYMRTREPDVELRVPNEESSIVKMFKSISNGLGKISPKRNEQFKSSKSRIIEFKNFHSHQFNIFMNEEIL